jgi:hypothetical protein
LGCRRDVRIARRDRDVERFCGVWFGRCLATGSHEGEDGEERGKRESGHE